MTHVIKKINFFRATSPSSRPIADSTHRIDTIAFIVTRIELDSGIIGHAYLLCFDFSPQAITGALQDVWNLALGFPVYETGRFITEYEAATEYFGHNGIHRWACGSINVAMWDAWAKTLGQPVQRLFGIHHSRVPLYGSGGWLSYSIKELVAEAADHVHRGFQAVKIKVGSPELEHDIERLTKVRQTVGPNINIMMDANQGMNAASAMALATATRELRISWFEEPLPHTDFAGYENLHRHAGVSLAMGEREFDMVALRELLRREALDLWQPDILRLGGVERWRASAALAWSCHVPVLPHYYKEYDVPLLATIPNPRGAESFDWVDPLLTRPLRMRDGYAYPPDEPGWGFSFRDQYLSEIT